MKYEGDLVFRRIGLQCADRQKKRMSLPMRKKEFSGGKKRIVQHPLIRFPSVWLNDIGAAPLFGRPHFIATHCLPDSRFNSKPFQYFVQTWIAADGDVQAPQGFFGFYGTARISPNGKIALTELKTFGIVQNGICVSLTAFPKGILSRIRENADGVFSVFSVIKFKFLF